jgi:hypothetical protein
MTTATTQTNPQTNPQTNDYLSKQNPHPRDAHIHFDEGPHKYTIEGINGVTADTEFTSVTTMVHQHFEHFNAKKVIAAMMRNQKKWNDPVANAKYYGKTAEEIEQMWAEAGKDASTKGTAMHHQIECFYNTPPPLAVAPATTAEVPTLYQHNHPAVGGCTPPGLSNEVATLRSHRSAFAEQYPPLGGGTPPGLSNEVATLRSHRSAFAEQYPPLGGGTPPEFEYFLNFNQEHVAGEGATLRPYRTEWTVFHEEAQIAGSIDMVYSHIIDDGSLMIYDWKRCREITKTNRAGKFATHPAIEHLPDTNFWHYALQLNIYKYILQTKYSKTITDLYLIVLHPDAQNYQRVKLPDLQTEVAELFEERIRRNNKQ